MAFHLWCSKNQKNVFKKTMSPSRYHDLVTVKGRCFRHRSDTTYVSRFSSKVKTRENNDHCTYCCGQHSSPLHKSLISSDQLTLEAGVSTHSSHYAARCRLGVYHYVNGHRETPLAWPVSKQWPRKHTEKIDRSNVMRAAQKQNKLQRVSEGFYKNSLCP